MSNVRVLKARQLEAIQLFAVGTPAYQIAERLEVSTMTIYRWQRQPEFEEKLRSLKMCIRDRYSRMKAGTFPSPSGKDGKLNFWNTSTIRDYLEVGGAV